MSAGLISIVMPVRDAAETVGDPMKSILALTWHHWELIAVDDGSEDATHEILTEFVRQDSRIRVMSTPPQGIARALQAGCDASAGDWIARMDADDSMHPERLRWQMEYTRENPELGVVSGLVRYGGDAPGYAAHVAWLNSLRTHEEILLRRFVEARVVSASRASSMWMRKKQTATATTAAW